MAKILATCPLHGEVHLTHRQVDLRVCTNQPLLSTYRFPCPGCTEPVVKPACAHVISLLLSGDVKAWPWAIPPEALEPHRGAPVSYDELLDFAIALQTSDVLAAIAAGPVTR